MVVFVRGRFFPEFSISLTNGLIAGFSVAQGEYTLMKHDSLPVDRNLTQFTSTMTLLATMYISMRGYHVRTGHPLGHALLSFMGYAVGYLAGISMMSVIDGPKPSTKIVSRRP